MTWKTHTLFSYVCDWPGCEADVMDGTDFTALDRDGVIETLSDWGDSSWWIGRDERSWYCGRHPVAWASDHENGEPYPARPFLLIHDGDTGDRDDDGKVSLIAAYPQVFVRKDQYLWSVTCVVCELVLGTTRDWRIALSWARTHASLCLRDAA